MAKLLWENKLLMCDICKERPMKKIKELSRGNWKAICEECEPKGDTKNEIRKCI